jgi:FkbH-like protein
MDDGEQKPRRVVGVAANFVADPLSETLQFWFRELSIAGTVRIAPFDQIIQQLLDPQGPLRAGTDDVIILVQFERWSIDGPDGSPRIIDDLANAVTLVAADGRTEIVIVICPASPFVGPFHEIPARARCEALRSRLSGTRGVELVTPEDIRAVYPEWGCDSQFDAYAERVALMPYTPLGFATLGTFLARRLYRRQARPRKVIAVDCDDTLWSGLCGEDGWQNIEVTAGRQTLQRFLINQVENGRLICLCSKNDEANVFSVFDLHPRMLLKREHLTAWRINWQAKADNLRQLATELSLGLDSFVFIDDAAFECEAMRSLCPEVLTLHLPRDDAQIRDFLASSWDLDLGSVTADDRKRSLYYHQNAERSRSRLAAASLQEFLASLNLEVHVEAFGPEEVDRAAQLSERTNQFNLNGLRRSVGEIRQWLIDNPEHCRLIRARDRFGDYGTVGLILSRRLKTALRVETLLLSCRALGKGVEQCLARQLATMAQAQVAERIEFAYRATTKNSLVKDFFLEIGARQEADGWVLTAGALALVEVRAPAATR